MSENDKLTSAEANILKMHAAVRGHPAYSRKLFLHMAATSGMETRFHYLIAPQTKKLGEVCHVGVIGFEPGHGVDPVPWADPTTRRWLIDNKLVTSPGANGRMQWAPKLLTAAPLGRTVASAFEDVLRFELRGMVRHFSWGCTQQHLMYSGLILGGTGTSEARPQTWQDLHRWYVNVSRIFQFERVAAQYTWLPDETDQSKIQWLAKMQIGSGAGLAENYYHGKGAWAQSGGGWKSKYLKVSLLIKD